MNFLYVAIETALPYVIALVEIMAILVISWSAVVAAVQFFQTAFCKKHIDVQNSLARGLMVGLEFAMAAEILKTILIQTLEEIFLLGGIIVLRIALSLLMHFENRPHKTETAEKNQK